MNDIFLRRRRKLNSLLNLRKQVQKKEITCPKCGCVMDMQLFKKRLKVCSNCNYHFQMKAHERIEMLTDQDSFRELNAGMVSLDPLNFPGYEKKLADNEEKSGMKDAVLTGVGSINKQESAIAVLDSSFLMGSMGTVVGEKITNLAEYARKKKIPLIIFSASGGARMQEGLFSLMQMTKTAAAITRFKREGGLFISVLTNPTTGGVSASYASLGDIMIAEPNALIGFAGPRVIEQTIGQKLPQGFQRSEFLLDHGMLDMIVERNQLKNIISKLLMMHQRLSD